MLIIHKVASWYLSRRMERLQSEIAYPLAYQEEVFQHLQRKAKDTAFGKKHGFTEDLTIGSFQQQVPVSTYEDLYPYIERIIKGETNVLWPGKIEWFSKSSGTTNDKSKYIPMSDETLDATHFKAGRDMLAVYFELNPESKLLSGKSLSIAGSHDIVPGGSARAGDLSAVLVENLPAFFELVRTPKKKVALMSEWESKIDLMAEQSMVEDVTGFAGVPTWTLILINTIFEKLGKEDRNLFDVWPNLEVFFHGGVNFEPYRAQFEALLPGNQMHYMNIYNASEGYFGFQDDFGKDDMVLLPNHGIFYEFVPLEEVGEPFPSSHTLEEVELGKTYSMVISTNAGLWRYAIGDTVEFTSKNPYRFRIVGRTKHFINAFGEELMVGNAEQAMVRACGATGAIIDNYTAAPVYFSENSQGAHEWLIEFKNQPDDFSHFCQVLDSTLKEINSDYAAKRYNDMALRFPTIHNMPVGTFYDWMKQRGKLGGQNKVPRLSNDRKYVDSILEMVGAGFRKD